MFTHVCDPQSLVTYRVFHSSVQGDSSLCHRKTRLGFLFLFISDGQYNFDA